MPVERLDLRTAWAPELLAALAALEGPVLVMARKPLRPHLPTSLEWWPLVDGPSAWFFLGHAPAARKPTLEFLRQDHREFDRLFREAVQQARAGNPECRETGSRLGRLLTGHLEFEEREVYPLFIQAVGDERAVRELGYEHRGIREGLARLGAFLESVLAGKLSKKQIDAFDIDFFHLIEHHVQREEEGLYPVLELLCPEECQALHGS